MGRIRLHSEETMKTIKTIGRTLMFVVIVIACVFTLHFYKKQAMADVPIQPNFEYTNNEQFLKNVNQCVDFVYFYDKTLVEVDLDLLLAQAALESGWGNSRFARIGKNLFGMRTYDLQEPHMLPSNNPKKWGVKVYHHECDSVAHYIKTLNNHTLYEKYRELLATGADSLLLVDTLEAYATDKDYFWKVKSIIKKIRKDYRD